MDEVFADETITNLSERVFATGEERKGERVTAYHRPGRIAAIMEALGAEGSEVIHNSSFGKLLSIDDKPAFSGRFIRFIISRQLQVNNKHEIWILFAGKPIRFSLREFAIVTGLPCGEVPKTKTNKRKGKKAILESSNWPTMFGKLDSVTVDNVIDILYRRIITDKEMRIKYACLALVDGVLMPTTHTPKLVKDHAELIRDLDEFFAYPWGRLAFDLTIGSIKKRDAVALSQKSLAVKGFVHALQLVFVEAVLSLMDVVQMESPTSDSDNEGGMGNDAARNSAFPSRAQLTREIYTTPYRLM